MSKRKEKARELFLAGYNCAQSVAAAYADAFGIEPETMLRMSASFGAGIGRMRKTCGAVCGMFIIAGLKTGSVTAGDQEGKRKNYETVRAMADAFYHLPDSSWSSSGRKKRPSFRPDRGIL